MLYIIKGKKENLAMNKISTVNARIEPKLKINAEKVLHKVGLTTAEAIRLFYNQILLHKGLPFKVKIPNATTVKAMQDSNAGRNLKHFDSVEALIQDLND